jgi:hypothetical protein
MLLRRTGSRRFSHFLGTLPPLVGRGRVARAITWMGNWGIRGVKQWKGEVSARELRM